MPKYGLKLDQLADAARNAARAAEQTQAHTIIYRESTPVAAIIPMIDLKRLGPVTGQSDGEDPLLSLCGSCQQDEFVDSLSQDLGKTSLFHPPQRKRIPRS